MAGVFRFALALAALLALSGCATLSDAQRDEAAGIARHARSTLVDCAGPDACAQPSPLQQLGQRALAESTQDAPRHYAVILDDAPDALLARIELIRSARRSIDLQTYIFDEDDSAQLVLEELRAAAFRGVRVRLLMDQLSALKQVDTLAAFAQLKLPFARMWPTHVQIRTLALCSGALGIGLLALLPLVAAFPIGEYHLAGFIAVFFAGHGHAFVTAEEEGHHGEAAGGDRLSAPMPGLVRIVSAEPGVRVEKGDPLVTMEAMKMELVLAAPRDGVVETVAVAAGDQVAEGAVLLRLVAEEPE